MMPNAPEYVALGVQGPGARSEGDPPPARCSSVGSTADFLLSDVDFVAVSRLIHSDTGILINIAKKSLLVSRLSRRLRSLGLTSFSDYVSLLESAAGGSERRALISAITTNVTSFFREPHHFRDLAQLGHSLASRARAGGRVRLWSAGCSTGQEAFSIAATLLGIAPDIVCHDVLVLATDIDPAVIETARSGVFDRQALGERPPLQLSRFLRDGPNAGQIAVSKDLQKLIRFEELNLLQPWPFQGHFDVIFCRNVVIYFDCETRLNLWARFAARMPEGGSLFIGHSERLDSRLAPLFTPVGVTHYRRTAQNITDGFYLADPKHELRKV